MAAAKLDIFIEQGATFRLIATMRDATGAALDITGWTFEGKIRKRYDSPDVAASFSFSVLDQTVPETKGQFEFHLSASASAAIPVQPSVDLVRKNSRLIYDVNGTTPGGDTIRALQGYVTLSPDVTSA